MSAEEIVEKAELFKGVVKMKYYGKYRGQVVDNKDPNQQGRIKAKVSSVLGGGETGWAIPCVPYAGNHVGFFFVLPIGANVWIEFEEGDPERPIWSGGFWGSAEVPKGANDPQVKMIKTDQVTFTFNDYPQQDGIVIENASGLKIIMTPQEIELVNGSSKIKITAAQVSVNNGALEVL